MTTDHSPDRAPRARRLARPVPGRRLPAALFGARMAARRRRSTRARSASRRTTGTLALLAACKRALLVTYRRDGTSVPTPVWAAAADGRLYVRTERSSGKVKRLRNDARLLVAPCTVRGKPLGYRVGGNRRVCWRPSTSRAPSERCRARYGLGRELFELTMDVLRVDMCFLEITPGAWERAV